MLNENIDPVTGEITTEDDSPSEFVVMASRLLAGLKAIVPCASKDEERSHLMQVRFAVHGDTLDLAATDGHSLGKLSIPIEQSSRATISLALDTSFVPTITKLLARIEPKLRSDTPITITIEGPHVRVAVHTSHVSMPHTAEQLEFPVIERAIPELTKAGKGVTGICVDPHLFGKIMKAASNVATSLAWTMPPAPTGAIRIDIVTGLEGIEGTYAVMPMKMTE